MEKTIGEIRVRTDFNPSKSNEISEAKNIFAAEINKLEALKTDERSEKNRCIAIAQSKIEEAAEKTVKALTA